MKYRGWLRVAVFSCCAASALAAHAVDCKSLSSKVLDNLEAGNYAGAGENFSSQMKSVSAAKLQETWEALVRQMGERGARDPAQLIEADGKTVVITPVHFGGQIAKAIVACSEDGRIAGFHIGQ